MRLILGFIIGFLVAAYNPDVVEVYRESKTADYLEGLVE